MNPETKNTDKEFEQYLQGKSGLSQQYAELSDIKFPDHLDAAILAEAHRAVGARPGALRKRNWVPPLSLVATLFVVIMAGLILPDMLKDMRLQQEYAGVPQAAPAAAPVPIAPLSSESTISSDTPVSAGSPAQTPGRPLAKADAAMPEPKAKIEAPVAKKEAKLLQKNIADLRERDSMSKQAEPAKPQQLASRMLADDETQPGHVQMYGSMAPELRKSTSVLNLQKEEAANSPAEISPALNLQATNSQDVATKRKPVVQPVEQKLAVREEQAGPAASLVAAPAPAPARALATHDSMGAVKGEAGDAMLQPEEWLKRIRKFKQDGKTELLRKELAAFRGRYPAYPVPKDLLP